MLHPDNQEENVLEAQILCSHCAVTTHTYRNAHSNLTTPRQGTTLAKCITLLSKQRQILKPACL